MKWRHTRENRINQERCAATTSKEKVNEEAKDIKAESSSATDEDADELYSISSGDDMIDVVE